jgi:hypothetical protein
MKNLFFLWLLLSVTMKLSYSQVIKIPYNNSSPVEIIVSGSIYYVDNSPSTNDPLCGVIVWYTSNSEDGSSSEAKILKGTTFYKTDPDTILFTSNSNVDTLYVCALDIIKYDNLSPQGEYLVKVNGVDYTVSTENIIYLFGNNGSTSVDDNDYKLPHNILLKQNYPNPFNPSTKIEYAISNPEKVSITIFDINGQLVKELLNEYRNSGEYSVSWNGRDNSGTLVASGEYFYQIVCGDIVQSQKMILLK